MAKLMIMGAGGMGTALAVAFSQMGHQVWLWGWSAEENAAIRAARENVPLLKGVKIPEEVEIVDTAGAAACCDLALIATPTIGVRGAAGTLRGVPVSYTHLDVYKRQSFVQTWAKASPPRPLEHGSTTVRPVSYTHLLFAPKI